MYDMVDVSQYPCHFTWEFADQKGKKERYLNDRIQVIEKELESQNQAFKESKQKKRNFPQLYALQGFLYKELYMAMADGGDEELDKANDSFLTALDECNELEDDESPVGETVEQSPGTNECQATVDENLATVEDNDNKKEKYDGYRAVIYGNLIHLNDMNNVKDKVDEYVEKYDKLSQEIKSENNAEVLAMKGFTASYFHLYQQAIQFYQKALEIEETAEWLFGLALVKLHRDFRRFKSENDEIEMLLRQAVQLDPSYDMAKIRLARLLWDERGKHGLEEIEAFIGSIQEKADEKGTSVMEDVAGLLVQLNDTDKVQQEIKIYRHGSLDSNSKSQKDLRALGNFYFIKWSRARGNKKEREDLQQAINYYTQCLKGGKPFDLTKLGDIHLQAYKFYNEKQSTDETKKRYKEEHKTECKRLFKEVEGELTKNKHSPKDNIDICFQLSQFCKWLKNSSEGEEEGKKEDVYLRETLKKAGEGSEEDAFGKMKSVKWARNRLLELVSEQPDSVKFQTKAWTYKQTGHFESALFYLEKAINKGNALQKSFEERADLILKVVKDKRKRGLNFRKSMEDLDEKIDALSGEKKRSLANESQKMKIEDLMSGEEVLNCLQENLEDLENFQQQHDITTLNTEDHETLVYIINRIVHASKVVLDGSVVYIKNKFYPNVEKSRIYYPTPANVKGKRTQGEVDKMTREERQTSLAKVFRTTFGWGDFKNDQKKLFDCFVDRLDLKEYNFLEGFFKVRNAGEHDFKDKQIDLLNKYFPGKDKQIEFAKNASKYASEVWKFIKNEVDK